jgi:hypothetical protein
MASEYIHTLWNLIPWNQSYPTTAESLSTACFTHIDKKTAALEDTKRAEEQETVALAAAVEKTLAAKGEYDNILEQQTDTVDKVKKRFKGLRDAVNLALESPTEKDTIDSIHQLFQLTDGFDTVVFCQTIETSRKKINVRLKYYEKMKSIEKTARQQLCQTQTQRDVIESQIKEIQAIQQEIKKRLTDDVHDKTKND